MQLQIRVREINCSMSLILHSVSTQIPEIFIAEWPAEQCNIDRFTRNLRKEKLSFVVVVLVGALAFRHACDVAVLNTLSVSMSADTVAPEATRDALLGTAPIAPGLTVGYT